MEWVFLCCLLFALLSAGSGQQDAFLKDCLDAHNKYRAEHGVPPLVWNDTLAAEAQVWANSLTTRDRFEHDTESIYNKAEGENLAYFKPPSPKCQGPKTPECVQCREIVKDWYDEVDDYNFNTGKAKRQGGVVLHFTQVVWKGSTQLGMATAVGNQYGFTSVARYYPRGNMGSPEEFKANVFPKGEVGQEAGSPTTPAPSPAPSSPANPRPSTPAPDSGKTQKPRPAPKPGPKGPGKCSRTVKKIKQQFKTVTIITETCETPEIEVPSNKGPPKSPPGSGRSPGGTKPPTSPPKPTPKPPSKPPAKTTSKPPATPPPTTKKPATTKGPQETTAKPPTGPKKTTPKKDTPTSVTTAAPSGPGDAAPDVIAESDYESFKEAGLWEHNLFRLMNQNPPLVWSDKLAAEAQQWADHIAQSGTFEHASSEVRNGAGENLAMIWQKYDKAARTATKMWYDEIKKYNFNNPGFSGETGHFTQVVWKGSHELGMGRAKGTGKKKDYTYIVARYKPAGNMMGKFEENVFPVKLDDFLARKRALTNWRNHKHKKSRRHHVTKA